MTDWSKPGTLRRMEEIALTIQSILSMPRPPAIRDDSVSEPNKQCYIITVPMRGDAWTERNMDNSISVFLYYKPYSVGDKTRVSVLRTRASLPTTRFWDRHNETDENWVDLFMAALNSPEETST